MYKTKLLISKNDRGFLLIEMLIGLAISSMIFLAVTMVIITMFNSNSKIQRIQALEQVKNDVAESISDSVRWGTTITVASDSLTIDGVDYTFSSGKILKGGKAITPNDVVVDNFSVKSRSAVPNLAGVEVDFDIHSSMEATVHDHVLINVSQRQTSVSTL